MCFVRPDDGNNFGCEEWSIQMMDIISDVRKLFWLPDSISYAGPMASVGLWRFLAPSGGMDLRADFEDLRAEQGRA
jgi:hypothetical protein